MKDALRTALKDALRARDRDATSALRSAIAAIDDAEAVPVDTSLSSPPGDGEHVAAAALGAGSADVPRRVLSGADMREIVAAEAAELEAHAAEYTRLDRDGAAGGLRRQAEVLRAVLARAAD